MENIRTEIFVRSNMQAELLIFTQNSVIMVPKCVLVPPAFCLVFVEPRA